MPGKYNCPMNPPEKKKNARARRPDDSQPKPKPARAAKPGDSSVVGSLGRNPLVARYAAERRWVNYRLVEREGKTTKIPVGPTGANASSTNPDDWSTYREARARSGQVGIVFTPAKTLLGIDLDGCLGAGGILGPDREAIAELILEADTYTEVSPSGKGLHLFLALPEPLDLAANRSGKFECYTAGRYFTVTGVPFGEARPIRDVAPEEALRLLALLGYPWGKDGAEAPAVAQSALPWSPLDDRQVVERMSSAKGGAKARALYDGDVSEHGGDDSAADLALCARLAFWTGGDAAQVERIWLASPLGQRKKTQARADYRRRTVAAAIAGCKEFYRPPAASTFEAAAEAEIEFLCDRDSKGNPIPITCTENAIRALRLHPDLAGRYRFDAFRNLYETRDRATGGWRPLEDNDATVTQSALAVRFPEVFGRFGKQQAYDALVAVAREATYDSAADWVRGLAWDETARLGTWLASTYGCPDDEYHRAVGANWLKGLVMRLTRPGCKFDHVLVLEGPQGSRKSTSLGVLGGSWHVETTMSVDSKDFFMQFQGKAIVEFSEGEVLSRTEVKKMKAIITVQSDKYRPPYERVSQDFPRRCVFAMTTNQEEYLKDETGNRRWLPVRLVREAADVEWLAANREQLFAEAYHRVAVLGEGAHEFPREATLAAQASRKIHDPNADLVVDWYEGLDVYRKGMGVTVAMAVREALNGGFSSGSISRAEEMAVAGVFADELGLEKRRGSAFGARSIRWYQPGAAAPVQPALEKTALDRELDGF